MLGILETLETFYKKDPAAKSHYEILLYPTFYSIVLHRISHYLWKKGFFIMARLVANLNRFATGVEIHPNAMIGRRNIFDHGMGTVIGETAIIGEDCLIYQGVTLGGKSFEKNTKRHPTIGNHVILGAGAKIIGNIQIGSDSIVGSNSVVTKSFPENSKIVGVNLNLNKKSTLIEVEEISTRENILEKFLNHFHLENAPTILY